MNWLNRTELLLGDNKLKQLQESHVLVVGLGGVGAWAAELLCRAGIGKMTIIDGDVIRNQPESATSCSYQYKWKT